MISFFPSANLYKWGTARGALGAI